MRLNAFSTPLSSTIAIAKAWPISVAFCSAASIMALASSAVTLGHSNVAAIRTSAPRPRCRRLDRIPLFGLAYLGQTDEIHELCERGQLAHRCSRRARRSDLQQYPPHGCGRREQRADGEDHDPVSELLHTVQADRGSLAPFCPVEQQRHAGKGL